jgi:hypothetical protein
LLIFTSNFHKSQYNWKIFSDCCIPSFVSLTGVRQGENVPSFLFSVFLNDLEDYIKTLDGVPLEKLKERFYNELHILFELFIILYADDTVLMSETKEGDLIPWYILNITLKHFPLILLIINKHQWILNMY